MSGVDGYSMLQLNHVEYLNYILSYIVRCEKVQNKTFI